jgi:hypothetical protein
MLFKIELFVQQLQLYLVKGQCLLNTQKFSILQVLRLLPLHASKLNDKNMLLWNPLTCLEKLK